MARRFTRLYVHLIWGTFRRQKLLNGGLERHVHEKIHQACTDMGVALFGVNSAWDHIHVLVDPGVNLSIGQIVQNMKVCSSKTWNDMRHHDAEGLVPRMEWQRGYGAVSIRREGIDTVCDYIANQKQRHRDKALRPVLEQTIEPPDADTSPFILPKPSALNLH